MKHIRNQKALKSIDFGCIADYGSFYVDYEPSEEINENGQEKYLENYSKRTVKEIKFS